MGTSRFDWDGLEVEIEHANVVNYALQRNDLPVVRALHVENVGDQPIENLKVCIASRDESGGTHGRWTDRIARLDTGDIWNIREPEVGVPKRELVHLDERKESWFAVELHIEEGSSETGFFEVERLPYNQWPGIGQFPQSLAAFVLPNHPDVRQLVIRMRDIMERWTGDGSLEGYQAEDRNRRRSMVASSYAALRELGFSYVNPPPSFEHHGQKVRTPEVMLNSRMGTCLDLVLFVAAGLEKIGLRPILVIVEGHAFVGVWLEEDNFADPLVDDVTELRKRSKLGEILFFDPTSGVSADAPFEEAETEAGGWLERLDTFVLGVDVHAARLGGTYPIASRVIGNDGEVRVFDQSGREERRDSAPPGERLDLDAIEQRAAAHLERVEETQREDENEIERLERWRSKLLDLTLRNRLLNFKHTQKTASLMYHDVESLEDELAKEQSFRLRPKPVDQAVNPFSASYRDLYKDEDLRNKLENSLSNGTLHSGYPRGNHDKRLKKIYRRARRERQEKGVNLLHVAIGFLRWYDPNSADTARLAPLVLLPAELDRQSAADQYELQLTDDEAFLNHSLLQKLDKEFGIEIEGLSVLPEDAHGLDVELIFKQFREAILEREGWDVFEDACLGIFSFGNYLMWHDLKENEDRLYANDVVRGILDPGKGIPSGGESETREHGTDLCVMEADSSQLSAVRAASGGESFVLQGPPGTGKSQTITNIIAQNIAEDRNVLFVAEKQAALDVVYRRLENVDLDDFSLKLHAESANKKDVVRQLGNALRSAEARTQSDWERLVTKLADVRKPIDEYVDTVHSERPAGLSLYQAVSRLTELGGAPEVSVDLGEDAQNLTRKRRDEILEIAERLSEFGEEVAPVAVHPLRLIERPLGSPDVQREARQVIESCGEAVEQVRQYLEDLFEPLPPPDSTKPWELGRHAGMLAKIADRPPGGRALIAESDWNLWRDRLREAVETARRYGRKRDELAERYDNELYDLDLRELRQNFGQYADAFFLLSFFMLFFSRRRLQQATRTGDLPGDDEEVIGDLDRALEVRDLEVELEEYAVPEGIEGLLWHGADTDWKALEEALSWTSTVRSGAQKTGRTVEWLDFAAAEHVPWGDAAQVEKYCTAVEALRESWGELEETLGLNRPRVERAVEHRRAGTDASWLKALAAQLEEWSANLDELREWSMYAKARDRAIDVGIEKVVEALESGELEAADVPAAAERGLLDWWTRRVIEQEPVLRDFSELEHERLIEQFRERDRRSFQLARQEVRARVSSRIPDVDTASVSSEIGTLLREIQKQSKHKPIREVFDRIDNLLPRIAPCMLMSPMSVAQYLSTNPVDFDLVIFDEASQIPPWNALGSISRADQCVVVGDPKQLPPTSFFTKTYEDGELNEIDDLESILNECAAAGMKRRRLAWHYRSRDESLIAFSNYHYYDNDLYTFPSAVEDVGDLGVSFHHVEDGVYDRGGSRTNRVEAEAVVDEIVSRLRDKEESKRSIGVVTFNQAQQELIEDKLEKKRREYPEIESFFSDAIREPVFVKNLENVQGDERDVMIFSICYAPDSSGSLTMNFGPLNQKGGERRLNVAITRAREELLVFSRLKADHIDLSRTSATAVEHLKTFLKYAEVGPNAIAEATSNSGSGGTTDGIRREVAHFLRERGWELDLGVGCSGYEIDIAVRHPDYPESYLLGIELDGENYRIGETARDRERTRPLVLEDLGWRLHRIWCVEWWHDPEKQRRKLVKRLEKLRGAPRPNLETETNPPVEEAKLELDEGSEEREEDATDKAHIDEQREWVDGVLDADFDWMAADGAEPFECIDLGEDVRSSDGFDRDRNLPDIADTVRKLVEAEGPVHVDGVVKRVAQYWGYSRSSSRIRQRILESLEKCPTGQRPRKRGDFLWPADQEPEKYRRFRPATGDDRPRNADEIPPEEGANAAAVVLVQNLAMPAEELHREIADAFGFSRLGANVRELAQSAVEALVAQGRAERDSDRIRPSDTEERRATREETTGAETGKEESPPTPAPDSTSGPPALPGKQGGDASEVIGPVPGWLEELLESNRFEARRQRNASDLEAQIFGSLIALIHTNGNELDLQDAAELVGVSPGDMHLLINPIQSTLNVEGYQVLDYDPAGRKLRLNPKLLVRQFGLSKEVAR